MCLLPICRKYYFFQKKGHVTIDNETLALPFSPKTSVFTINLEFKSKSQEIGTTSSSVIQCCLYWQGNFYSYLLEKLSLISTGLDYRESKYALWNDPTQKSQRTELIKTLKPLITPFLQISGTCQSVHFKISTIPHHALYFADTFDYWMMAYFKRITMNCIINVTYTYLFHY